MHNIVQILVFTRLLLNIISQESNLIVCEYDNPQGAYLYSRPTILFNLIGQIAGLVSFCYSCQRVNIQPTPRLIIIAISRPFLID